MRAMAESVERHNMAALVSRTVLRVHVSFGFLRRMLVVSRKQPIPFGFKALNRQLQESELQLVVRSGEHPLKITDPLINSFTPVHRLTRLRLRKS